MLFIKLFLLIILIFQSVLALFVVTAPQSTYTARYGDTVQMVCKFPVTEQDDLSKLTVSWQHVPPQTHIPSQVTMFNKGREDILSQDNMYKGRASLMIQKLKNGMAILKIEEVKLTDAGKYLCVLHLAGSDFKSIMLNVQASYSTIVTFSHISEDNKLSLTCESLGFPEAEVYWKKNGVNASSPVNTSHTQTTDGFYKITSTIKGVNMSDSYHCVFWNQALNEKTEASLEHSGLTDILKHGLNSNTYPHRNDSHHQQQPLHISIIPAVIGFLVILIVVMVIVFKKKYFKKKGDRSSTL
ncbi:programmed cell death 1 ligand 2-like isoform X2 [Dendrobates tinctorius]|uniref:programmed cell death 1 ligand 2-like isoform X2 n=1 Tax=Dendrobates tinctorius TaxID=92724 RepID=UPI003CCA31FA